MKRKPLYLSIGSVSHGTLRSDDLIEAFRDTLQSVRGGTHHAAGIMRAHNKAIRDTAEKGIVEENTQAFIDAETVEQFGDMLQAFCPDYCSFGSHPGDGADFGVWVDFDRIEEDRRFGELLDVENVPKGYSGTAVEVNDHSNMTLYAYTRGRRRELWSIV